MITKKFEYKQLTRATIDGSRKYLTPEGEQLVSVTTILDRTKSEESRNALANWRKAVGVAKAQEITTEAANRGTRMHKWLENYVLDETVKMPGTNPYSKQSWDMAQKIIENGLVHCTEFWGTEVPLYFSGLYAGTTDLVGAWKGKPAIMDFKQSNKVKQREWIDDYFVQLAAYALAHNEMHGTEIETGVVLMCTKDYQYLEFVIEGDEFKHYTDEWLKRVEQYYKVS
jgi:genome maintenance exonuclease 1